MTRFVSPAENGIGFVDDWATCFCILPIWRTPVESEADLEDQQAKQKDQPGRNDDEIPRSYSFPGCGRLGYCRIRVFHRRKCSQFAAVRTKVAESENWY